MARQRYAIHSPDELQNLRFTRRPDFQLTRARSMQATFADSDDPTLRPSPRPREPRRSWCLRSVLTVVSQTNPNVA